MQLPLTMKVGKVGHGQHCWAAARRPTEQCGFQPVIVPLRPKRTRDPGGFGPLQDSCAVPNCGQETPGGFGDFGDRTLESLLIGFGWLLVAADFTHELESGLAQVALGGFLPAQDFNTPAHSDMVSGAGERLP